MITIQSNTYKNSNIVYDSLTLRDVMIRVRSVNKLSNFVYKIDEYVYKGQCRENLATLHLRRSEGVDEILEILDITFV